MYSGFFIFCIIYLFRMALPKLTLLTISQQIHKYINNRRQQLHGTLYIVELFLISLKGN